MAHTPSPTSSGAQSPARSSHNPSMSSSMISTMWTGFMRHFSSGDISADYPSHASSAQTSPRLAHAFTEPVPAKDGINDVFVPSNLRRTASPFRPPPLEPIALRGFKENTPLDARLLSTSVAEEIRIMLPERLRIIENWELVYSLEQDGSSLATLYQRAARAQSPGQRVGFVLVVRDETGGIFGAYLSEYPRPATGYFGNGECFLWRASTLAGLPPPPSADTTNLSVARYTTVANPNRSSLPAPPRSRLAPPPDHLTGGDTQDDSALRATEEEPKRRSRPQSLSPAVSESIRFKAFPYSGINEYFLNCETGFLSLGAGDGHYGLWLDSSLYRGRSGRSQTFGNEPLSDQGEKFGILGVELWVLAS